MAPKTTAGTMTAGTMTAGTTDAQRIAHLEAQLAFQAQRAEAETARADAAEAAALAAAAKANRLYCKVADKGGISVFGLNARFPVTLYRNQWARIAEYMPTILQFGVDNADLLSAGKPAKTAAE